MGATAPLCEPRIDCPAQEWQFRPMKWAPQYHTACQIQRLILDQMGLEMAQKNQTPKPMPKGLKPSLKPGELCALTKAWSELEDRKRILRGKGLPKPIEAKEKPRGPVHQAPRE